tara:strand:+ start:827 stop:1009 length:183 start_codon:yes stop_codon:yes gene_type:complete
VRLEVQEPLEQELLVQAFGLPLVPVQMLVLVRPRVRMRVLAQMKEQESLSQSMQRSHLFQ